MSGFSSDDPPRSLRIIFRAQVWCSAGLEAENPYGGISSTREWVSGFIVLEVQVEGPYQRIIASVLCTHASSCIEIGCSLWLFLCALCTPY
jgi:hypothetical protein